MTEPGGPDAGASPSADLERGDHDCLLVAADGAEEHVSPRLDLRLDARGGALSDGLAGLVELAAADPDGVRDVRRVAISIATRPVPVPTVSRWKRSEPSAAASRRTDRGAGSSPPQAATGVPPLSGTPDGCADWPAGKDVGRCRDPAVLVGVPPEGGPGVALERPVERGRMTADQAVWPTRSDAASAIETRVVQFGRTPPHE